MSRTLLAVFAHPDDETFLAGGTLAKYAGNGWEVTVLSATRGEAGLRGEYEKENLSAGEFALVRQREMEAACDVLGVKGPLFLNCADVRIEKDCRDSAQAEVARFLRERKPDVVITFGPDGVSGHADHVAIGEIVTTAVRDVGIRSVRSGIGHARGAFRVHSLYYAMRSGALPPCCRPTVEVPRLPVTTMIDVSGFSMRKLDAMRCYRSQKHMQPENPDAIRDIVSGKEPFHRAFPAFDGKEVEDGLFLSFL